MDTAESPLPPSVLTTTVTSTNWNGWRPVMLNIVTLNGTVTLSCIRETLVEME